MAFVPSSGGNWGLFPNTGSKDRFQRSCNCYNIELSGNQAVGTTSPLYVLIYPPGLPAGDSLNTAALGQREQGWGWERDFEVEFNPVKSRAVNVRA